MLSGLLPSLRFGRSWVAPHRRFAGSNEVHIPLPSGETIPATLFEFPGSKAASRGWVVLHGMTRRGRNHPELLRFQHALAATGGRVLVPQISEWVDLRFAPERAQEILRGSVAWLDGQARTARGGIMLVGLSFGAPQAILAASDPQMASQLRAVLAWGGYSDLGRAIHFSLSGQHAWKGEVFHQIPDPYVRWIIGSNGLPYAFGESGRRVGKALHTLAAAAGDSQTSGAHPTHDSMKSQLREQLSGEDRRLFDLFVPPGGGTLSSEASSALIEEILPKIRSASPLLDPLPLIQRIDVPIRILHGRNDHLIPFTEALHMQEALAPISMDTTVRVTGLLSHSGEDRTGSRLARGREGLRLLEGLRGVFRLV